MELLQTLGSVVKIVIMPTDGEQSFFQGFDNGVVKKPEVAELIFLLSKTPKDIKEIFIRPEGGDEDEDEELLVGQNTIILVSREYIEQVNLFFHAPFCLIFCVPQDFNYVKSLSRKFTIPPIICSGIKGADILPSAVNSIYSFDNLLYSKLKVLENKLKKNGGGKKVTPKLKRRGAIFKGSPWSGTLNNTTKPNELLIESMGYMLSREKELKKGSSRREFINCIINSVVAYEDCLRELGTAPSSEVIVYAPGMFSFFHNKESSLFQFIEKDLSSDEKKFLINGVLRNPDYSGYILKPESENSSIKKILNNPKVNFLIRMRRAELRLTTAAISLFSINKNSPAIRLPNAINHFGHYLKKLEQLACLHGIDDPRFIKKGKAFNTLIKRVIGGKLRGFINDGYNDITFVCDIPLDWVRFGKIPIMLSHDISRINVTPGNFLLQNASTFLKVVIKSSEMRKFLIIRSFEPDDHLKFHLEMAIETFKENMPDLDCLIVDVRTKDEFIDALNQYDGYILIIDCHGSHGGDKENGWLVIGGEKVDTWQLKKVARVPPIVILSACLTSAVSGSHASVANGLLVSGALSVIGTLLPVNAIDSAVFVSRLIYRFYQFPLAIPHKYTHINMRLFLSLFLRMSYVSDIFRGFEKTGRLAVDSWYQKNIEINTSINMLNPNWFEYLVESISEMTSLSNSEIYNIIETDFFITETMCYSQIGFPDSIEISLRE